MPNSNSDWPHGSSDAVLVITLGRCFSLSNISVIWNVVKRKIASRLTQTTFCAHGIKLPLRQTPENSSLHIHKNISNLAQSNQPYLNQGNVPLQYLPRSLDRLVSVREREEKEMKGERIQQLEHNMLAIKRPYKLVSLLNNREWLRKKKQQTNHTEWKPEPTKTHPA